MAGLVFGDLGAGAVLEFMSPMPMRVRTMFRVQTVSQHAGGSAAGPMSETVTLCPVPALGLAGEGQRFWESVPKGELQLVIVNPAAFGLLELGASYYLDITPAAED